MTDWQDIATAPKDGTDILVHMPYIECECTIVYWSKELRRWCLTFDGKPLLPAFRELTYWMPLPPPPK